MQAYVQAVDHKVADELLKAQVLQIALRTFTHSQAATDKDLCFYTLSLIDQLHACLGVKFGRELRSSSLVNMLKKLQQHNERTQRVCDKIRERLAREPDASRSKLIGRVHNMPWYAMMHI